MNNLHIYAFADEASPRIDEQIKAMVRNGLQGLEIRNVDGENVSAISLDKAREVRKKLDDAGLITWSIGSPLGKIDIEKGSFEEHLDSLRHTLEVASVLGAKNIRMFSFFMPAGKDPAIFRNQVMDRLHRMVEVSAGSGIALCHENEKGIYGDVATRCLDVLTEVPELHGVFDPANFVQCGQDTLEAWEMLKDRINYMHIKDALFSDSSVVPAGKGDGHVGEVLHAFLAKGGCDMTVEPHLAVFDGLKGLERKGDRSIVGGGNYVFSSNDEAFDAACSALKALLA
ncbi:MAG: sugar phosphate isomerase/epimerase [Clostridia bacterium]|nr:sugar phosphate isomerase/epimerase [Clostridia bacterium]MBQ9290238.1 sugar phosphate isomerase/epimerase [Clostridia bacterium]